LDATIENMDQEPTIVTANEAPVELDAPTEATEAQKVDWGKDRDVPLSDLDGLSLVEQFFLIWATPERGKVLWDLWYRTQSEAVRGVLDSLAQNMVDEHGVTLEEARTQLAVEKMLADRGMNLAANYVDSYKARKLRNSRTLKPMILAKKKKK
jgi:hypothetical protein